MGVAAGQVACLRGAIESTDELSGKFIITTQHDADDFTISYERLEV